MTSSCLCRARRACDLCVVWWNPRKPAKKAASLAYIFVNFLDSGISKARNSFQAIKEFCARRAVTSCLNDIATASP